VLAVSLVVATACGGSLGASTQTPASPQLGKPWSRLSVQQKDDYMRSTVMPEMRAVFARFDPHRYAKMGCSPCHARGRGKLDYRMPNEDLLLDPAACAEVPGGKAPMDAMNRFMGEQVGPTMARLLGKPWTSCYWCHEYDG
jgi:hypothetical protein